MFDLELELVHFAWMVAVPSTPVMAPDVILESSVEPFNELFVRSVLFGLGIKILESNDFFVLNSLGIIKL